MDWKQTREAIPRATGSIAVCQDEAASGHIKLSREQHAAEQACVLISRYERNLYDLNFGKLELFKIKLESKPGFFVPVIPLAPLPEEFQGLPEEGEVCSLGVMMKKGLGQIWFILRVSYGGHLLHYHLETTSRSTGTGLALDITANVALLPINLLSMLGSSKSEPLTAFSGEWKKRHAWARLQVSPVADALTDAIEFLEDQAAVLEDKRRTAQRGQISAQLSEVATGSQHPADTPISQPENSQIEPTKEKKKRW